MKEKDNKKLKLFVTVLIIGLIIWFLIIYPLIKFKRMEKEVFNATKRYYEINEAKLPRGSGIKKVSLDTLYSGDFIKSDLRAPYTNKYCNSENSFGRVIKKKDNYEYGVYLDCGIFKSKIDHDGPIIRLKGEEEVTIYQGQEYKDDGISSVIDDTDGNIDIKNVKVDTSKVDTSKVGEYEVTYTVKDSLDNETVKIRKVNVTQTLNNIVDSKTNNKKVYTGYHDDNYVMIDSILFKIVGINSDNTVKLVTANALGSLNYEGIDSWLNDYFYNKLSDSAKELIYQKSKWCVEKVSDINNYSNCRKYSKKKAVGQLSIIDYKNAKDKEGLSNLENTTAVWTSNATTSNNNYYVNSYFNMSEGKYQDFKESSEDEIYNVKPVINIIKDTVVVSGDGSNVDPYILKGNNHKHKKGNKISSVETGSFISYSGYTWRVIGKEDDETTQIISMEALSGDDGAFYTKYDNDLNYYDPNLKDTLAYNIVNKLSSKIKTSYLVKKKMVINRYEDKVSYGKNSSNKSYNLKLREISLFDLYSPISTTSNSVWYQEIAKNKNIVYVNSPAIGVSKEEFDSENEYGVRVVGYLNKDVVIKDGSGTSSDPYTLTK